MPDGFDLPVVSRRPGSDHRDRHGSKFVLRFHQGRCALTQSTVPQVGQATSKAVSRVKVRRGWRRDISGREATEYASDVCIAASMDRHVSMAMRFDHRELTGNSTAPNRCDHDLSQIMHDSGRVVRTPPPRRDGSEFR